MENANANTNTVKWTEHGLKGAMRCTDGNHRRFGGARQPSNKVYPAANVGLVTLHRGLGVQKM